MFNYEITPSVQALTKMGLQAALPLLDAENERTRQHAKVRPRPQQLDCLQTFIQAGPINIRLPDFRADQPGIWMLLSWLVPEYCRVRSEAVHWKMRLLR